MASFALSPGNIGNSGQANSSQMNEVFLGQILSEIVVRAILSFDDPVASASNSGQDPNAPSQQSGNQVAGSSALTKEGGLSFGGGVRLGNAGTSSGILGGISAAGTTTVNKDGYQTSGGISIGGLSLNAGAKLGSGGLSFSGGIQKAQVGQGLVGSKVGPAIVGPKIVGPKIVGTGAFTR